MKKRIIDYHYHNRFGWIRIYGIGFKLKDTSIYQLTFPERYGHKKGFQLGKWRFTYLTKNEN